MRYSLISLWLVVMRFSASLAWVRDAWNNSQRTPSFRADHRRRHNNTREAELKILYNLNNTRAGEEAVNAAVAYLNNVETGDEIAPNLPTLENSQTEPPFFTRGNSQDSHQLPICNVNHEIAKSRGKLVYVPDKIAPYDVNSCWIFRTRYHDAPACSEQDQRPAAWQFDWMLDIAQGGKCEMPPDDPLSVARQYWKWRGLPQKRRLKVMMLGLSFVGGPFQAYTCNHDDQVSGGEIYVDEKEAPKMTLSVESVKANGGHCTGYHRKNIKDWFPPSLHGSNYTIPRQNHDFCTPEHARIDFGDDISGASICYKYTFNVNKNVKPGDPAPCGWDYKETDLIMTLVSVEEILDVVLPNTGAPDWEDLKHLTILPIDGVYEGLLLKNLIDVYEQMGMGDETRKIGEWRRDHLARPQSCEKRDVHYALPGIPDIAAKIWWQIFFSSLLGTSAEEATKTSQGPRILPHNHPAVTRPLKKRSSAAPTYAPTSASASTRTSARTADRTVRDRKSPRKERLGFKLLDFISKAFFDTDED